MSLHGLLELLIEGERLEARDLHQIELGEEIFPDSLETDQGLHGLDGIIGYHQEHESLVGLLFYVDHLVFFVHQDVAASLKIFDDCPNELPEIAFLAGIVCQD